MLRSVKSKLLSKGLTKETENRLKQACSTTVSGLQTTLSIAKDVTGVAGVPGLQAGISSLLFVIDVIKKTAQNAEDVEKLSSQIEELNTFLGDTKSERTFPPAVTNRIGHLSNTLTKVSKEIKAMGSRGVVRRLIRHGDDIQAIGGHIQTITWEIQSFTVESVLAIEFALDGIQENIDHQYERMREEILNAIASVKRDAKDGQLPRALSAAFDCIEFNDRTRCYKGTRKDVLRDIFHWIGIEDALGDAPCASSDTLMKSRIFWMNGSAGTGKTTIAYTIAAECRDRGILGASFFCSRDHPECRNPGLIVTTIAHQLGAFSPLFQVEVSRVIAANHDICYAGIPYQLEQLIVNPLRSLGTPIPPCVVVVDALDECRDNETTSLILLSLFRFADKLFPIKFFVTSRPENHITTAFKEQGLESASQKLILHEVRLDVVEADIAHYLSSKLALTRIRRNYQSGWPSTNDIRKLARLSHGLFIFAATSVRFIEDRNYADARDQLESLLCNIPPETEDTPHFRLYQLYTEVLKRAFPRIAFATSGRLKMVLGSITLLRQPLSPVALDNLLRLKPATVQEILANLHSVVIVPDEDTRTIRLLHPSFRDFITSPQRCQNPDFVVNSKKQDTLLARACFQVMKGLRQDVCRVENPSILNSEVDDLSTRIKSNISSHMQYSCCHWASHLANALFSNDLVDLIEEFCGEKILNWLEVCSLLGELRNALLALNTAQQTIKKSGWDIPDALNLLHDCERFTLEFFPIISSCSLQIYHSALLFTPKQASIRKAYREQLDCALKIYNAPDERWNPCLRAMEGHTSWVNSISFSPDGTRIVSGSDDKTLRLWDAVSGAHLTTLSGHSDRVTSVAFSSDGTRVVSGSDDKTLRLWNAISGAHLATLSGHSYSVTSVAFSKDRTRVVSGSRDKTLRLWDAATGTHFVTLSGHSHWVTSVAFSGDGTRIASGSHDQTLRLWDAVSGAYLSTLRGHSSSVTSVASFADSTHIVSGSDDKTLRLWDAISGEHLATLSGHSSSVTSVAFSAGGTHIASGSHDKTLRVWDASSGAHLATLTGHSQEVNSIAFSADGTRIASGSHDKTLRLWDVVSGAHITIQRRHSDGVTSVAFSPDGTRVVSGSNGDTLRLWDAVSAAHLATLSGHSSSVTSVAFSADGTRIASGSHDKTLRLWDAVSGAHLVTLSRHSYSVRSISFSADGTRMVSGSDDNTLCLWDAISSAHLTTLSKHSSSVTSVAFSADSSHIVSGSNDNTFRLWDAVSGAHLATLSGRSDEVTSIAFSPDGTRIVSGHDDNTLRVWDTASGRHLDAVQGHKMCASALARSLCLSWTSFSRGGTIPSDSMRSIFSYVADDGWIHSINLNRRICWIPLSCRPNALDVTKDRVAFGTADGRVVILHFDDMDAFFRGPEP